MEIIRKEYSVHSLSGLADIFVRCWYPDDGVKAIFQMTHGMAEHGERYEEFASRLCAKGFAVCVHDHEGHGKSVRNDSELGYFGDSSGWNVLVEDTRTVTKLIEDEFPDVPLIYYGHSMGSFIAREYIRRFGTDPRLKAAIICGTSGSNPGAAAGIILSNIIAKAKGTKFKSETINKIAFGTYLKNIPSPRTPFDWLSYDNAIVDKYIADPLCGFLFSAVGYRDLFTLLKTVSSEEWYEQVPKTLPILLTAGEEDPVGAYGKGVREVCRKLKNQGCYDVTLKLYPGMRHEIHNEVNREKVYEDIGEWALSKLK
ncbi:MAG: lysophospholipase [Clostridia bacterium]|nr:lysophospholipase [Clostridia bacterium]